MTQIVSSLCSHIFMPVFVDSRENVDGSYITAELYSCSVWLIFHSEITSQAVAHSEAQLEGEGRGSGGPYLKAPPLIPALT